MRNRHKTYCIFTEMKIVRLRCLLQPISNCLSLHQDTRPQFCNYRPALSQKMSSEMVPCPGYASSSIDQAFKKTGP